MLEPRHSSTERSHVLPATVLLVAALAAPARAATPLRVPEGGLVLDGGDLEREAAGPSLLASAAGAADEAAAEAGQAAARPVAFEYSDGYYTRLKIHKYASYAMLPVFVGQYVAGQKLYDGTGSEGTRSVHGALAAGTAVLFGVNTVTGVWNLSEARKDPTHRTKRMLHGGLMLLADAGFVATGLMAPEVEEGESSGNRSAHRTVALASMGVATVAYLMMLIH